MRFLKIFPVLLPLFLVLSATGAEGTGAGAPTVILDQFGSWRMFQVLARRRLRSPTALSLSPTPHSSGSTSPPRRPPRSWTKPEFNDVAWLRGPVGMASHAPFAARICLRGRFLVADPAKAKTIKLTATYHGGAIVYLNGEEIGRKNLAPGANLAEAYPLEAFVTPKGEVFGMPEKPDAEDLRRMALRERTLEVELPARLLRKGVNVLAVEIIRAPYHKVVDEKKRAAGTQSGSTRCGGTPVR